MIQFLKKLLSIKIVVGLGLPTALLLTGHLSDGLWMVLFMAVMGYRTAEKIIPEIRWEKKDVDK